MNIAKNSNSKIQPGDLVFSVPHGENGCLVGKVTAIVPLGSLEHESGNKTNDIHVDFFAPYSVRYSDKRTAEIAQEYSALYGKPLTYDELPLDDVIMSPDSLVRINGIDTWDRDTLLASREKAEAYYDSHLSEDCAKLHAELIERVDKNFADYRSYLMGFGKDEIIDMADKIHAMSDARTYMTSWHDFDIEELRFFLQFQKPLEVLADVWCDRNSDLCDMGYSMDHIKESSSEFLEKCPLLSDMPAPIKQEKTPADKKRSIGDRIAAGKEKAEAYKTQNPPDVTKHNKKELD